MSPAHHSGQGRLVIVALVLAVLVGGAVLTHKPDASDPGGPPVTPGALVSSPAAESAAWYCTGQSTTSGKVDAGTIVLTNTTAGAISGTISAISDTGTKVLTAVTVPARGQLVPSLIEPNPGSWIAESVILARGGVAVTQAVKGPAGWSETPCASRTAEQWYFPSGTTSGSDGLFVSLYNPTSTPDVVDLSFITPGGPVRPINFEGIVIEPGGLQVANVSAYVQDQSSVATEVSSRTGRVVAAEAQEFNGSVSGLSLVDGSPLVESQWVIPQNEEVQGGASEIDVFNPGTTPERVTVRATLDTGPLAPFSHLVPALSTWVLSTSSQTRIPKSDPYAARISAAGGPGVVVGRLVTAPSSATAPQAGLSTALDGLSLSWTAHRWIVPTPGSTATPAVSGAIPEHVGFFNPTGHPETVVVTSERPRGTRRVMTTTVRPGTGFAITGATLFRAGLYPLLIEANGALAVSEDVGPTGAYGVVTMPAIPVAMGS